MKTAYLRRTLSVAILVAVLIILAPRVLGQQVIVYPSDCPRPTAFVVAPEPLGMLWADGFNDAAAAAAFILQLSPAQRETAGLATLVKSEMNRHGAPLPEELRYRFVVVYRLTLEAEAAWRAQPIREARRFVPFAYKPNVDEAEAAGNDVYLHTAEGHHAAIVSIGSEIVTVYENFTPCPSSASGPPPAKRRAAR